jgi:hypothetical protein
MTRKRNLPPPPKATVTKKPRLAAHIPPVTQPVALLAFGNVSVTSVGANPTIVVSPPVDIANLKAPELPNLTTAIANYSSGEGTEADVTVAAQAVHDSLENFAAWVQGQANKLTPALAVQLIVTAGFQIVKPPVRQAKKAGATTTSQSGIALVRALVVVGAIIYAWEQSSDNKTWSRVLDTNHVTGNIGGLVIGQTYYFRYRTLLPGVGGAEPAYSGYSQVFDIVAS